MDIVFYCIQGGQTFYRVMLNGQQLFVGSQEECDRYLSIRQGKVEAQRAEDQRVPRARPFPVRTFRQARAQA